MATFFFFHQQFRAINKLNQFVKVRISSFFLYQANQLLSRCPEGKWDGMKQGCSWHLCVGLLLKTGSSSHLYIQSLCTHYVLRSSELQAPEIWSAFGKLCRLDAVCQNFLRGFTSHLIRFTSSSRTVALHSYVTFSEQELKKSKI